jgi:hypothetical protein
MPARKRATLHLVGPVAPERKWSARVCIPVIESSSGVPQRQEGGSDAPAVFAIRLVVREIEGRRCAIFLTESVNAGRIVQRFDIGRAHFRAGDRGGRPRGAKRVVDDGLRCGCDETFGQRFRLGAEIALALLVS